MNIWINYFPALRQLKLQTIATEVFPIATLTFSISSDTFLIVGRPLLCHNELNESERFPGCTMGRDRWRNWRRRTKSFKTVSSFFSLLVKVFAPFAPKAPKRRAQIHRCVCVSSVSLDSINWSRRSVYLNSHILWGFFSGCPNWNTSWRHAPPLRSKTLRPALNCWKRPNRNILQRNLFGCSWNVKCGPMNGRYWVKPISISVFVSLFIVC